MIITYARVNLLLNALVRELGDSGVHFLDKAYACGQPGHKKCAVRPRRTRIKNIEIIEQMGLGGVRACCDDGVRTSICLGVLAALAGQIDEHEERTSVCLDV
jgi:hypothetical protein